MYYGVDKSRFVENKRVVKGKIYGSFNQNSNDEMHSLYKMCEIRHRVAGVSEIGAIGRGENMQITTYLEKAMESELSANVIDLMSSGCINFKTLCF